MPRISKVDETIRKGDTSKMRRSARCGTMCSLTRNFMPSATFWKNPGTMVFPIHDRLLTRSTVANFSSRLPKFLLRYLLTAPSGLPKPNGSMFHHSPAVTPFSPTQRERSAVVAPYRSCMRATALRSIQRMANWEKNSSKNTTLTTAKVATANERLLALSSSGVPSRTPMMPERSRPSLLRKKLTRS